MSAVAVRLTILGSGSAGNCTYVETDETRILIDAGFSLRQIRQRLATIGRTPENLTAILITSALWLAELYMQPSWTKIRSFVLGYFLGSFTMEWIRQRSERMTE